MDEKDKSGDEAGLAREGETGEPRPVNRGKVLLLMAVALLVLYGIVGRLQHDRVATAVSFRTSWEQAAREARESGKVVFADFYADWCGPCRTMDSEVFSRKEFGVSLEEMAVPLRVDLETEAGAALAARYGVDFIPNYIVLTPDGQLLARADGVVPAEKVLGLVRGAMRKREAVERAPIGSQPQPGMERERS